jgi:hypothetical protein
MKVRRKKLARGDGLPERFILLDHNLLDSEAFRALSAPAVKVLVIIMRRYNGANNGEISFGVREGEAYGLSRNITAAALEDLQNKGFLVCTRPGHFAVKRLASTWCLTMHKHNGQPATRHFSQWTPPKKQNPVTPAGLTVTPTELSSETKHSVMLHSHAGATVNSFGDASIVLPMGHL